MSEVETTKEAPPAEQESGQIQDEIQEPKETIPDPAASPAAEQQESVPSEIQDPDSEPKPADPVPAGSPAEQKQSDPADEVQDSEPKKADPVPAESPPAEQKESDPASEVQVSEPKPADPVPAESPPAEQKESNPASEVQDSEPKQTDPTPVGASKDDSADDGTDIDRPAAEAPGAETSAEQKVVIVTGANSGIGLVATEKFAADGFQVIMACRSEEKAKKAVQQVEEKVAGAKVSFMKLDLASLKSVREFAAAFLATGKPLHILCNNAGLTTGFSVATRSQTEDGFEMTFGVNHLGHFLLTVLLLEKLKETASQSGEVRVVHVSSSLHDPDAKGGMKGKPAHLDFDDLMLEKPDAFAGELAYRNSKLANCAFSVELAKRLDGTNVTSNTICPGLIPDSGLMRNETWGMRIKFGLVMPMLKLMGVTRTLDQGGSLIYDVATNSKWKGFSGKHFAKFEEIPSSVESRDPEVGKKLWDASADLVHHEQAKAI